MAKIKVIIARYKSSVDFSTSILGMIFIIEGLISIITNKPLIFSLESLWFFLLFGLSTCIGHIIRTNKQKHK